MAKFNITLLDPEFGLKDTIGNFKKFAVIDTPLQSLRGKLFRRDAVEVDDSDIESMLSTPVYDTIEFESGFDSNGESYNGLRIDTALITVDQSKNIVTTPIQGRNGTIKEYISDGDFLITITGLIIGESIPKGDSFYSNKIGNKYPENDVQNLKQICSVKDTISINSRFLSRFNINDVVITSYRFEQVAGKYNSQAFEISLISDLPEEILNVQ